MTILQEPPACGVSNTPFLPAQRTYSFRIYGTPPPANVTLNGVALPYVEFGGSSTSLGYWRFDGETLSILVEILAPVPTNAPLKVSLALFPQSVNVERFCWQNAVLGKMRRALMAKRVLDPYNRVPGTRLPSRSYLSRVANAAELFSSTASSLSSFNATVVSFLDNFPLAVSEVEGLIKFGATFEINRARSLLKLS